MKNSSVLNEINVVCVRQILVLHVSSGDEKKESDVQSQIRMNEYDGTAAMLIDQPASTQFCDLIVVIESIVVHALMAISLQFIVCACIYYYAIVAVSITLVVEYC